MLAGVSSARLRGARVRTGPRLVARAVAAGLESNTRCFRCSSARRFAGFAQLSGCGARGGEPNGPQHLTQEDGAEFASLVAA